MLLANFNFRHLFQVRKYFGLTQSQLGELLGVSKNTVSDWENGSLPSLSHFIDLCHLFSLPYQFFLDYTEFSFEDISLCLDVYYVSYNLSLDDVYSRWFTHYPVSHLIDVFNDDCFGDDFSWISEFMVLDKTFSIFRSFYCRFTDYFPPSRFFLTFHVWLLGGDQIA